MNLRFSVYGWLLALAVAPAHADETPPVPPAPASSSAYALVEAMIGGAWMTTVPAQNGVPAQRIEIRFTRAENRQAVLYQSWKLEAGKRIPYQNGIYARNAAKENMEFFCTDSRASLTEGSYTAAGNVLTGDFTIYNPDGSTDPVHTQVTQVSPDLVTEQVFLPNGDGWAKATDLRLERQH